MSRDRHRARRREEETTYVPRLTDRKLLDIAVHAEMGARDVFLWGARRFGKSAVLRQAAREIGAEAVVVEIAIRACEPRGRDWYTAMIALMSRQASRALTAHGVTLPSSGESAPSLTSFFHGVNEKILGTPAPRRLFWLFDDLHLAPRRVDTLDFFAGIAAAQADAGLEEQQRFVFASRSTPEDFSEHVGFEPDNSPFNSCEPLQLRPFGADEIERYLLMRCAPPDDDRWGHVHPSIVHTATSHLGTLTGGRPQLCELLLDHALGPPAEQDHARRRRFWDDPGSYLNSAVPKVVNHAEMRKPTKILRAHPQLVRRLLRLNRVSWVQADPAARRALEEAGLVLTHSDANGRWMSIDSLVLERVAGRVITR